jgi:hypothetical protein
MPLADRHLFCVIVGRNDCFGVVEVDASLDNSVVISCHRTSSFIEATCGGTDHLCGIPVVSSKDMHPRMRWMRASDDVAYSPVADTVP